MGTQNEAERACAECTISTAALVGSFVATAFLGPVGACLAMVAMNTASSLAKEVVKAKSGESSYLTKTVGAALVGFFFSEVLIIADMGIGGLVGSYMDMLEEELVAT